MTSANEAARRCRCCSILIPTGRLACPEHWFMLPTPLRHAIFDTYRAHRWSDYVANVRSADAVWEQMGVRR